MSRNRSRLWWWLLGLVVAWLLVYVGRNFVGAFAFALFLYYFSRPIASRLETHLPHKVAVKVTLLVVALPFALVLGVFVAIVLGQLSSVGADVQAAVRSFIPILEATALPETPDELLATLQTYLNVETVQQLPEGITGAFTTVTGVMVRLSLVVVTVSLLLTHDRTIAAWFRRSVADEETSVYAYLAAIDRDLRGIYFGQMLTVFSVMILAWLLYRLLNLVAPAGLSIPYPLLLGLLTGIATFVPLIGRSLLYVPISVYLAVVAILQDPVSLWFPVVTLLAGLFGLDSTIRYVVRPYLTAQEISTGLMLIAYLLGAAVFGWYGVFLAPLLLVVTLRFFTTVFPPLVRGDPIASSDPHTTSKE